MMRMRITKETGRVAALKGSNRMRVYLGLSSTASSMLIQRFKLGSNRHPHPTPTSKYPWKLSSLGNLNHFFLSTPGPIHSTSVEGFKSARRPVEPDSGKGSGWASSKTLAHHERFSSPFAL